MDIYVICEPVDNTALWITDIVDGIIHESMKKGYNIRASTDGNIDASFFSNECEDKRRLALVVGYSIKFINKIKEKLCLIGVEPILVSIHENDSSQCCVSFNTADAMRKLVEYIVNAGKKSIAFFGFHNETIGDLSKLRGFSAGIRSSEIKLCKDDIYSRGILAECANRLYENIYKYQAVICTSDLFAVYLICFLSERGIKIPEDIYITGFGNWVSIEHFQPSITRMYTDLSALGSSAVKHYVYMQNNPQIHHSTLSLGCILQIGYSTEYKEVPKYTHVPTTSNLFPETPPTYDSDPNIMNVLKLELMIRSMDETDISMIKRISEGKTYAQISDEINISESTIKYRLNKLEQLCGFSNRNELMAFATEFRLI